VKIVLVLAVVCMLAFVLSERSESKDSEPERVAYLRGALDAVRGLGPDGRRALEDALYTGARTRCRSQLAAPSLSCLVDLATATCADREGCALAADVVLVAILSENDLVDEATRVRLVATSTDYRAAMRAELGGVRASLAADFVLAAPGADDELPARIDRFCSRRERDPAYQRCAAALIWYIGSEGTP
jgi:hypothetical protein